MQPQIHQNTYNTPSQQYVLNSPKNTYLYSTKPIDKTLPVPPSNSIKHYSSNPNISLEMNNPRPQTTNESNSSNMYSINKNIDFRVPSSSNVNSGYGSTQVSQITSPRAGRQSMTQSLFLNESDVKGDKIDPTEEVHSPKKEMFKNVVKRPVRMS